MKDNWGRRLGRWAVAIVAGLAAASVAMAQPASNPPPQTGGASANEPGDEPSASSSGGGDCTDSNTPVYNQMYGGPYVILSQAEAGLLEGEGKIFRCGGCPPDREICWLKPGVPRPSQTSQVPPAPGKGLVRTPQAPGPPATRAPANGAPSPTDAKLLQAMDRCLGARLPYYAAPTFTADDGSTSTGQPVTATSGAVTYWPTLLDRQPLQTRVFQLATAMARQAQDLHDGLFGKNFYAANPIAELDRSVGFLDRCVELANLKPTPDTDRPSPDNPTTAYAQFLGVSETSPRMAAFSSGYTDAPIPPPSLLQDPVDPSKL